MRIGRTGFFLALSVILFAGEGHVSSGIRKVTLEELARRSNVILVVSKASPPFRIVKQPFPKPAKEYFNATEYAFKVLSVVRDEERLVKGKTFRALSPSDEDNYEQTWRALQGKPMMMTIHPSYEDGVSPDSVKRFILFATYNRQTRRFSITASGAYEREERLDEIHKSGQPPPPTLRD